MLVNTFSALLAAAPLAAALNIRGGPGGWGHGGGHFGGGGGGHHGGHDDDHLADEDLAFRIITYDSVQKIEQYFTETPGNTGNIGLTADDVVLYQTADKDESETFHLTDDGYLYFTSGEGADAANLYAVYPLNPTTEGGPVWFVEQPAEPLIGVAYYEFEIDYDTKTLVLVEPDTPERYIQLCPYEDAEGDEIWVFVIGDDELEAAGCRAAHLDIDLVYDEDK